MVSHKNEHSTKQKFWFSQQKIRTMLVLVTILPQCDFLLPSLQLRSTSPTKDHQQRYGRFPSGESVWGQAPPSLTLAHFNPVVCKVQRLFPISHTQEAAILG